MSDRNIGIRLSVKDAEIAKKALRDFGKDGHAALSRLEKSTKPAGKGLKAVDAIASDVKSSMAGTATSAGALGAGLTALGPAGIATAAALAVVTLGAKKLYNAVGPALETVAALKDQADLAGTTAEAYQELSYAAEKTSVSQDALADGLKEVNLRADEWIQTGKGPAEEAFRRLGYTQDDLAEKLKNSDELLVDIIRRMEGLDTAAQIRVSDEIFGGSAGEQFVRFLEKGADEITKMRHEARSLGLVIDDEMVKRADEGRDKLALMSKIIDVNMTVSLTQLAPLVIGVSTSFAELAGWVGEVVDGFVALESKTGSGLDAYITEKSKKLQELQKSIENFSPANLFGQSLRSMRQEAAEIQGDLLDAYENQLDRESAKAPPKPTGGGGTPAVSEQVKNVMKDLDAKLLQLQVSKDEFERTAALASAGVTAGSDKGQQIVTKITKIQELRAEQEELTRAEQAYLELEKEVADMLVASTDAVDQRNQSYGDYVANQEQAIQILRLTLEGKTEEVALLQAEWDIRSRIGELLPEEAAMVAALASERANLDIEIQKNQEETQKASQAANDLGLTFTSAFEDAVFAAEGFGDIMRGVIEDIARIALRTAVTQPATEFLTGAFTSLLAFEKGGIMSSAGAVPLRTYSQGGVATGPQLALYGEGRQNEAYVPLPDNRSIPVTLKGAVGGGGDQFVITQHISVQAAQGGGADSAEQAQNLASKMGEEMRKTMEAIADSRIRQSRRTGGLLNPIRSF